MTTIIDLNDLRHSINRALNLGRYQIVVKTAGAEQVPASITLDLLERDDDGFKWPVEAEAFPEGMPSASRWATTTELPPKPCGGCDGKGHVGPIQGREDAVQGCTVCMGLGYEEENDPAPVKRTVEELVIKLSVDSSDFDAQIAAMTKKATETAVSLGRDDHGAAIPEQGEQRAAIRAGFDGIVDDLRTMRDMTALGEAITEVASGAAERRASPGKWRVYREGGKVVCETFDQTEPEPAADPMPPVGPLTSTEGLKAGDVLVFPHKEGSSQSRASSLCRFVDAASDHGVSVSFVDGSGLGLTTCSALDFVARPGVWMPWEGGENPVPGLSVRVRLRDDSELQSRTNPFRWSHDGWDATQHIMAYMVVDTPPASSDT